MRLQIWEIFGFYGFFSLFFFADLPVTLAADSFQDESFDALADFLDGEICAESSARELIPEESVPDAGILVEGPVPDAGILVEGPAPDAGILVEGPASDAGILVEGTPEAVLGNAPVSALPPNDSGVKSLMLASSSPDLKPISGEAPLEAPIRWAKGVLRLMESGLCDYSCTVSKRERINGILGREEIMEAKVRQEPFSVYLNFLKPNRFSGREVIYVENANEGELLVHGVGLEALAGTIHLDPDGRLAMKGNLHPITDFGIQNLVRKLVCMGEENLQKSQFSVTYFNAKLNGRDCTCIEVINSDRGADPLFHKAHVYVDMELNLPVKYVSWGWGNEREEPLMEEYSYTNIQLNPGFTDLDFDVRNPDYEYRESH